MLSYHFPCVKGTQAGSDFYICMVPLGLLSKLFAFDTNDVPPEYRAQRKLNESRIPEIREYILGNRDSYVFSALAASIDGQTLFIPSAGSIGTLEVDMNATFLINDGQHRRAAIEAAIEEDSTLAEETIPIVFFKDKGLKRSQQMFSDLNKHAVISSKSLNTLYESKDSIAIISKRLVDEIPFFHRFTDKEKDNLGKFSSNLFTLNTFYSANKCILKGATEDFDSMYSFVLNFWRMVVANMTPWTEMVSGEISKKDLRENYIVTQGITLIALGRLGNYLHSHPEVDIEKGLEKLQKVDWLRNNTDDWLGRAIKRNGQISRSDQGIFLTYVQIKRIIGLEISAEELRRENRFLEQ